MAGLCVVVGTWPRADVVINTRDVPSSWNAVWNLVVICPPKTSVDPVIPAKAGIQESIAAKRLIKNWIPAYAGMTNAQ